MPRSPVMSNTPKATADIEAVSLVDMKNPMNRAINRKRIQVLNTVSTTEGKKTVGMLVLAVIVLIVGKCFPMLETGSMNDIST